MTSARPGSIAILGLGLIGGSIARALASGGAGSPGGSRPRVTAWSPDGRGPKLALADGVIDSVAAGPAEALDGADLVIIAAPPLATIELIERLGGDLGGALAPGAVVTDVASTKGAVMRAAERAGIRFVGGHPMAGREASGYAASSADLLHDRPWVVVLSAGADPDLAGPVRWLAEACGARTVDLDAASHDAAVAAISHLPLVASVALVEAVAGRDSRVARWPLATALAASGWDGMTRLARGDPRMGAGIAATNAAAIVEELRAYRAAIDSWIEALATDGDGVPDVATLERRLATARATLQDPDGGAS